MAIALVTSYVVDPNNSATTTTTTTSFTPSAGEVIVVKAWNEWSTQPTAGTPTGGGLTYTLRASYTPGSQSSVWIWTAVVGASPSAMTVSVPWSGTSGYRAMGVERWSGASLAATPATNATQNGSGAPSATITTTGTSSVITWIDADRSQTSGTVTYRSSATEVAKSQTDTAFYFYSAYQSAASAGSQTIGMTSPSGQTWGMIGIEIQTGSTSQTLTANAFTGGSAFGAHTIAPQSVTLTVGAGITSGEAFGTSLLQGALQGIGIDTVEAFGQAIISGGLLQVSIPSGETFGAHALAPQPVSVTVVTGIATGAAFGAAVIIGSVITPTGIGNGDGYGTGGYGTGGYGGDAGSSAFGLAALTVGAVDINTSTILTGSVFGLAFITSIATQIRAEIITRPAKTVKYELVCVARIPQPSGPPVLLEVDPVDWTGLSYTQELSKPGNLNAGVSIASLTDPIIQRLEHLAELASELWLYRDGKLVFAGPWLGWQVQGETLTLNGVGLLGYLNMMVVENDMVFSQVDQFKIVTDMIDAWQNAAYGNFGINTTGIAPSGVPRDGTYLKKELHIVGTRVAEIGARQNGFNLAVDPASRKLLLGYPVQGVDRSSGQDAVVFDQRNVTSPNIICSSAPGDVASEGYGTGTSNNNETVYSVQSNLTLRAQYGRTGIGSNFDGVSDQTTLDAHTLGMINARSRALLIPGPDVRVTPDSDVSSYDVGDVVSYQLHTRLSVAGAFRLQKRTITVSQTGQEAVSVAFV